MLSDSFRFYGTYLAVFVKLTITDLFQRVQSLEHRLTYRNTDSPRNVVVVGGSFAGLHLARRLANSLPTGYRVVLIEQNSHFNYLFGFPRFSVLPGHEHKAFIPYDGIARSSPAGIFERIQAHVTDVRAHEVVLQSGATVGFDFLAIATGTARVPPTNLIAKEKAEGCEELRSFQKQIKSADSIAVVGGGAVGVQISTDIKSVYPRKRVALIHSRDQLLPNFQRVLHDYVVAAMSRMGVEIILNERPSLAGKGMIVGPTAVEFKNGQTDNFDLIIPCTGQHPPSSILSQISPQSISAQTGGILVKPTLQILDDNNAHIFALGDVAETGGAKMARAGASQAEIVRSNIVALIKRKSSLKSYKPDSLEGALKLTLGRSDFVMYVEDRKGRVLMHPGKSKSDDLDVDWAWKMLGLDPKEQSP